MSSVASSVAERIALDQLRPLVEPRVGDVRPPGLALDGIVLEREQSSSEKPRPRGEPDRRVAARAADLEHLDTGLRGSECEEEAAGRRRDLARALARPAAPASRSARSSSSKSREHASTRSSSTTRAPRRPPRRPRVRIPGRSGRTRTREGSSGCPLCEIEARAVARADDDARARAPSRLRRAARRRASSDPRSRRACRRSCRRRS